MKTFLKSLNRRTEVTGNKSIEKFKGTCIERYDETELSHLRRFHNPQKHARYAENQSVPHHLTAIPTSAQLMLQSSSFFSSPTSSLHLPVQTQPIEPKKNLQKRSIHDCSLSSSMTRSQPLCGMKLNIHSL